MAVQQAKATPLTLRLVKLVLGSALGRILAAEEQTDIPRPLAVNKLEIDSSFLSSEVNGMDNVGIWLSRLREECALFSQTPLHWPRRPSRCPLALKLFSRAARCKGNHVGISNPGGGPLESKKAASYSTSCTL